MSDKKDDAGKAGGRASGSSVPPAGDGKRPHAIIDLKATEVVFKTPDATAGSAKPAASDVKPAATVAAAAKAAPQAPSDTVAMTDTSKPAGAARGSDVRTATGANASSHSDLPPYGKPMPAASRGASGMLSHAVAGIAGALAALAGAQFIGLGGGETGQPPPDVARRLAQLEQVASQRPTTLPLPQSVDQRIARLEEAAATLTAGQTKMTGDLKSVEDKVAAPAAETTQRLARLEETLTTLKDAAGDPRAGRVPQLAQIAGKLSELEGQLATRTTTLRSEINRDLDQRTAKSDELAEQARSRLAQRTQSIEQSVKSISDETTALRSGYDGLKSDLDARFKQAAKPADIQTAVAPVTSKLAALEKDVQSVVKSEKDRNATAGNILLSLELANLKRALDRGGAYASELAAVQQLAGGKLDLRVLESQQKTGVATLATLSSELRGLAHAMLDAEVEPADASVTDKVLSGFKSIVRVRKTTFGPDDKGTEATIARMETALKESRIADVIAEAGKLTPKAAAPAADWIKRIEGRHAIDKALTDLEASLKTSLAGGAAPGKGN